MTDPDDNLTSAAFALRHAFRQVAASVSIVTAYLPDGSPCGMTASSMTTVSLDPPSILVAVNDHARLYQALQEKKARFMVNILNADQKACSHIFSSPPDDASRFTRGEVLWQEGDYGLILPEAMAHLSCHMAGHLDYGTHRVIIGHVDHCHYQHGLPPLIHHNGRYLRWLNAQEGAIS